MVPFAIRILGFSADITNVSWFATEHSEDREVVRLLCGLFSARKLLLAARLPLLIAAPFFTSLPFHKDSTVEVTSYGRINGDICFGMNLNNISRPMSLVLFRHGENHAISLISQSLEDL